MAGIDIEGLGRVLASLSESFLQFMVALEPALPGIADFALLLSGAFVGSLELVAGLVGGVVDVLTVLMGVGHELYLGIAELADGFGVGLVDALTGARDTLVDWFSGAGDWLTDAGRNILDGLLGGMLDGFREVQEFVGGIGEWIAEHKGPKAYDLALLVPAGGWIMDGLRGGIESQLPALRDTLAAVSGAFSLAVPTDVPLTAQFTGAAAAGLVAGVGAQAVGAGTVVNIGDINVGIPAGTSAADSAVLTEVATAAVRAGLKDAMDEVWRDGRVTIKQGRGA